MDIISNQIIMIAGVLTFDKNAQDTHSGGSGCPCMWYRLQEFGYLFFVR